MNYYALILLLLVGSQACSDNGNGVDDPSELAEACHQALVSGDTARMKELFMKPPNGMERVQSLASYVKKGTEPYHTDTSDPDSLELTYWIKGNYFSLIGQVEKKGSNYTLSGPKAVNVSKRCQDYKYKRYQPNEKVHFRDLEFETTAGGTAFSSAKVHIENRLDWDIENMKFTFKIFFNKDGDRRTIYRRSVTTRGQKVPVGEVTVIELAELDGLDPGVGELKSEKISYEGSVNDAEPKPPYKWCKMKERLDEVNSEDGE